VTVKLFEVFLSGVARRVELEEAKCTCDKGSHYACLDLGRVLDYGYRLYYFRFFIRSDACLFCEKLRQNLDNLLTTYRDWLIEDVARYDNQYKGRVLARYTVRLPEGMSVDEHKLTEAKYSILAKFWSEVDDRWLHADWALTRSALLARIRISHVLSKGFLTLCVEGKLSRWARARPEHIIAGLRIVRKTAGLILEKAIR